MFTTLTLMVLKLAHSIVMAAIAQSRDTAPSAVITDGGVARDRLLFNHERP